MSALYFSSRFRRLVVHLHGQHASHRHRVAQCGFNATLTNSRDWQQLIEMCRVVDTVLVDQEAVYAPRQGNDRLLLGLKGSLNEYELDLLRQRSPVKSLATAPPISRAIATPLGLDRAPRDGVCGCWEAVGKWPAGATVESLA